MLVNDYPRREFLGVVMYVADALSKKTWSRTSSLGALKKIRVRRKEENLKGTIIRESMILPRYTEAP